MFARSSFVSEADAIRAYISTLRAGRGMSQDALASQIGMAPRTYKAWETGETKDIKIPRVLRAIRVLGGTFDHLEELDNATEDDAKRLAREWVQLTPEQQEQVTRLRSKVRRVIELSEQDPDRLEQVIERLRSDARADPAILDLVLAYIDGRRSAQGQ